MPLACAAALIAGGLLASATASTTGLAPAAAKASVNTPVPADDITTTTPSMTDSTTPTTPTTATTPTAGRAESWASVAPGGGLATAEPAAQADTITVGGSGGTLTDALDDAHDRAQTIAHHEHLTLGDVSAVVSPKPPTVDCGGVSDGPDLTCSDEVVVVSYEIDNADDIAPPDDAP
jgi:hypothetical protein